MRYAFTINDMASGVSTLAAIAHVSSYKKEIRIAY
jgi:hypothetical protein